VLDAALHRVVERQGHCARGAAARRGAAEQRVLDRSGEVGRDRSLRDDLRAFARDLRGAARERAREDDAPNRGPFVGMYGLRRPFAS
jgi:hypothetical protein